jgi:ABC-type sugar transport system substrate-binding protein
MKKMVISLVAALSLALVACTSDAVAVIQATELGFNLLWGFVPLADPSFDSVVNKSLIAEAKAMGGNKVEIVSMFRMNPDQFPFNFMPTLYLPGLLNLNMAYATGVAVK